jgi:hypothetical protein
VGPLKKPHAEGTSQAFYNRSLVRLSLGDWKQGLEEFESRWDAPPLNRVRLTLPTPQWSGREDISGKTLFIYHEQGFGDTLQCARYVPTLAELDAKVILVVPAALRELMETLAGRPQVISLTRVVPAHDLHCPLMSLMRAFGTRADSIPSTSAYLHADAQRLPEWEPRLGVRHRPRIGVAWSGRAYAPVNYPRDVPLDEVELLFSLDADFISLQTEASPGDQARLAQMPEINSRLILSVKDFSDTAALIECLDLVICADTAVAHLAGALGKPVWLMNRYASCWRWGQRSSWYPSLRIFRQRCLGDWRPVVEDVRVAAAQFIATWSGSAGSIPAVHSTEAKGQVGGRSSGDQARHPDSVGVTDSADAVVLRTAPLRPEAPHIGRPMAEKREKIRLVCATRHAGDKFLEKSPLWPATIRFSG